MQASTSRLEVRSLGLELMGSQVLTAVSAIFEPGAVTAIVGPSGAGKSSLLRCLNRLEEPQRGEVLLNGINVRDLQPTALRRRVGMIFQTPVLFEGGVRGNLTFGLAEWTENGLVEALEASDLSASFLDRSSTALSVGQAQRVCIARTLVRSPEAILMDEPTSALDKDATAHIERLMGALAQRGLCVVVVTHDLTQARRVADSFLFLRGGELVAGGSIEDIAEAWPDRDDRR